MKKPEVISCYKIYTCPKCNNKIRFSIRQKIECEECGFKLKNQLTISESVIKKQLNNST